MIRRVSSTIARPTASTPLARLSRPDAAWSTPSWAARCCARRASSLSSSVRDVTASTTIARRAMADTTATIA